MTALWAALSALACALAALALSRAGLALWTPLAELGLALLLALALRLGRKKPGEALLALLLAQGAAALLNLIGDGALAGGGAAGLPLALAAAAAFAGACAALFPHFPPAGWCLRREGGPARSGDAGRRTAQVYLIPALLCALFTAGRFVGGAGSLGAVLLWGAVGACLYWGGISLMLLARSYREERSAVLAEQQYREEMQRFMSVIRSQRHDYNFHVQTIAGLIQAGKIEECRRYVDALEQDSARMNAILPLQDPAISATIHHFQTTAARDGIELHVDIQNDLAQIATNVYETNKIISNLLQNAIDETSAHADKSYGIWLTILKRGEYCVIRVSNALEGPAPTADQLGYLYRQGYTTKQGHDGVGLSSIRELAARYRGTVYTQLEGGVIHFVAKIPINYAKVPPREE